MAAAPLSHMNLNGSSTKKCAHKNACALMLSAFTWYANYHFTVNNGGIRKNKIFSKNRFRIFINYFFENGNFLRQSLSTDMQTIIPPPITQE